MKHFSLVWSLCCLAAAGITPLSLSAADGVKPNVVLILADDLGWTDLGCFGSELYETPHLDRLAADGMKFTQNYSACTVCSPTRAALLTGKYPARLHITDWIPGAMPDNPKLLVPDWTKHLPLSETTLAEVFRAAGYAAANIGKWHLGTSDFYPEQQGFDINIAGTDKPSPPSYFAPWNIPTLPEGKTGDYLTDRLGEEAVQYVERVKDRPFFLYLPHFAVHTPIQGPAELAAKYQRKLKPEMEQKNPTYAAMVESMDATVGRIRAKLEELNIADRTIIAFTSDNGGRIPTTSNRPLRYGKASAYEGGVRVPLIVHWPGVTKAGSASDVATITMDMFPTLVEMCGLSMAEKEGAAGAGRGLDGVSLAPVLRGSGAPTREALYWHYPHHQHYQLGGTMPYGAIRAGDFKLIEFYNDRHVELYNIREDIGEAHDLAAEQPERARELRERLHAWRQDVGAQMPTPNPNHDPARPEYTPPPMKPKGKGKAKK
jgi:arylsulfatase A-like enzyme